LHALKGSCIVPATDLYTKESPTMAPAPTYSKILSAPRPPRLPIGYRPSTALFRAAGAAATARATRQDVEAVLAARHPGDDVAAAVLKAAIDPGSTGATGWAAELTQQAVGAFLADLAPLSAGASLFSRVPVQLPAEGLDEATSFPSVATGAGAAWVAENDPAPVTQPEFSPGEVISPRHIRSIVVVTRELARGSRAEPAIRALLTEAASARLDLTAFDDEAGDDERPAGLLYGVAALAAYPGGDVTSLTKDISALVAATSAVGGETVLIMSPARAVRLSIMAPALALPVLPSAHVAEDHIIAIKPRGLAVALGAPSIDTSSEGLLHMSSTPSQIVDGTAADPVRALWQTDVVAVRLDMALGWCRRHPATAAHIEDASW
jgi:hypothetical protein